MKMVSVFRKNKDNKGFTLIELLATLAILSIVLSIVIYFALNIVNNSKEKSYETTINNVQNTANTYVLEDNTSIAWKSDINDSYQYQCITVQKMIDKGYFKNDVLDSYVNKNQKLKVTDYIYVERNIESKVITKSVLLVNEYSSYISGLCGNVSDIGNINFIVKPSGWSKEKEITIRYELGSNNDKATNYKYDYKFNDISLNKNFNSLSMIENLKVDNNGTLNASIKDINNNVISSNSLVINKIDDELPVISINSTNNVSDYQTVTLNMSDNAGISKYYFGKEDPSVGTVEWITVSGITTVSKNQKVDSSGIWYLGVKDIVGNTTIISKEFYKTTLSVSNAIVSPNTIITMEGNSFEVPNVILEPLYTFVGWYNSDGYMGNKITTYKPISDITLYGKTIKNELTGGSVKITGVNAYGNTLTAQVTDTSPVADKYEYQWYYNSNNSVSGGTQITGATANSYKIGSGLVGKYIYVVVTAKKNNYRDISFSDITDISNNTTSTVSARTVTITAKDQTVTYGTAITKTTSYVTIGGSGLASGDSLSSVTLTQSTTNVTTSGTITPSVATINNSLSTDVTSNYTITYKTGTLTINKVNATCPTVTAYSGTYDAASHTITVSGGSGGTIQYRTSSTGTWGTTKPTRTNAGTTTVYVQVAGDGNHNTVDCGNTTIAISQKVITVAAEEQTINYGSSIVKGVDQVTTSGLLSGHTLASVTLTASTADVTTSGTIVPSEATINNSSSTDVTSNYSITYKTGTLTINKVNATCPTVTAYSGTYDAVSHTITVSGGSGGTIQYRTSSTGTWGTTKPTRTSAGTTTVYVQVAGDSNHNSRDCGNKTIKINKANCSCEISSYSTGLKYPENKTGEIKYNCSGDGSIYVTSGTTNVITAGTAGATSTALTAVGIGSSTITVGRNAGTNYNACSKTQSVSVAASTYTIKYNNNGGSGTIANQTATYGKSITISDGSGFSKSGYEFVGWTTKSDGTDDEYGWSKGWSGTWNYSNGQYGISSGLLQLYAKWKQNTVEVNADRYNCPVYGTDKKMSIYHITTCSNGVCNFDQLNRFDKNVDFSMNINNPISWKVDESTLYSDFGQMKKNCGGQLMYVTYTGVINCRKSPSLYNDISPKKFGFEYCNAFNMVRTTNKVDDDYDWFYSPDFDCFMTGKYLRTTKPSDCSSSGGDSDDSGSSGGSSSLSCPNGYHFVTGVNGTKYCCPEGEDDPNYGEEFCYAYK